MSRQDQIGILKRLLHYVDTRTTAMAEAPWQNHVSVYTDTERLGREQQILFRQHPILMGFASEWGEPGAFRTDDYAGVPILVVRGRDRKLRAFLNVCRHRGAKVAQGCGSARLFSCPYHAWTYDLAGKVMGIPDERCFPDVRPERSALAELPLCEKHGLVWVIPTTAVDGSTDFDIDPWLGGLGPELASFEFASWTFYDKRVIPETMNWKILVDTFNEGYHIGFLHRDSLKDLLHGNVTDFESFGLNHHLTFPRKKLERLKGEPEDSWDLMWNTTLVYSLFPNTVLLVQGDHVELARLSERGAYRSCRDGAWALRAEGAEHGPRAHPLGQEYAARSRRGDGRGLSDRTQYSDWPDVGSADPHGLRPQRAGDDPLSPVDATCA